MCRHLCSGIILLTLISFSASNQSLLQQQDSVRHYIDTVFNIIQSKSLYRNGFNWTALRDSVDRKTKNAKTILELMPSIGYIFESIGDHHGSMIYNGKSYGMKKSSDFVPRSGLSAGFRLGNMIRIAMPRKKIGYINIPGNRFTGDAAKRHAQQIQDSICKLQRAGAKKWIIDLRMDLGGNMHPMIAGLSGILDDGILGYFIGPNGEKTNWRLEDGKLLLSEHVTAKVTRGCTIEAGAKVAVLLSQITSSSGEIVAISFKGRANTKFFGENTSGYVSANESFQIDKHSLLVVASAAEADRNNAVYSDFVRPDVHLIEGDNFYDLQEDEKVLAAVRWLKSGK